MRAKITSVNMQFAKKLHDDGYKNVEIGKIMGISQHTIWVMKKHEWDIYKYKDMLRNLAKAKYTEKKEKQPEDKKEKTQDIELTIEEVQKILDHVNNDQLIGILDLVVKELTYRQQEDSPRGRFK